MKRSAISKNKDFKKLKLTHKANSKSKDDKETEKPKSKNNTVKRKMSNKLTSSRGMQVSADVVVTSTFENMGLRRDLLKGIYAHGFQRPSAIQQRAIEQIVAGKDVIAQAQSGTGKTATFAIGILQCLDITRCEPQALILSPTRELAQQSLQVVSSLGAYLSGLRCHAATGGSDMALDRQKLRAGCHVLSGTPGRVWDLLHAGFLSTRAVTQLILDEADEMLQRNFRDQIQRVVQRLPAGQVILVSATLLPEVLALARNFMLEPVRILVRREQLTLERVRQFHVAVERECWKFDALTDLYRRAVIPQAVVFCNTRHKVAWLSEKLHGAGFIVLTMHGDMEQKERETVLNRFRAGAARLLVTTDVWARGIDVQQVSLVLNYDIPNNREVYLHRIGRCGRFGRHGVAVSFVTNEDNDVMKSFKRHFAIDIPPLPADLSGTFNN